MNSYTADELQEAIRPIASLISKSEKAQQKMKAGMWQYRILQDNLKALRHVLKLMNRDNTDKDSLTEEDPKESLRAITSMISKTEKAQVKFSPGNPKSPHHIVVL